MKKGSEEKTKFSKIFPNNQIITACHIERRVQETTMNEKLNMIGLIFWWHKVTYIIACVCYFRPVDPRNASNNCDS